MSDPKWLQILDDEAIIVLAEGEDDELLDLTILINFLRRYFVSLAPRWICLERVDMEKTKTKRQSKKFFTCEHTEKHRWNWEDGERLDPKVSSLLPWLGPEADRDMGYCSDPRDM
jgi:hypothetical protein